MEQEREGDRLLGRDKQRETAVDKKECGERNKRGQILGVWRGKRTLWKQRDVGSCLKTGKK